MFWRLWWRAISVKRSQAGLALASLIVGAAVTSMLLNLYGDVRRKMTEDFRAYGANVVIAPAAKGFVTGTEGNTIAEQVVLRPIVEFARQAPGTRFAPVLYGVVQVSSGRANSSQAEFTNAVATGADLAALANLEPGWRSSGADISTDLSSAAACAVGAKVAKRLHLWTGDSIELRRVPSLQSANAQTTSSTEFATYHIDTVLTTGGSEDDQVFLPLAALQSLLGMGGKITLVELSVPGDTREVESAVSRLSALLPGLDIRPVRQIVYSDGKVLGTIRWLLFSLTALILIIIVFCVMAAMTAIVLERSREVGVMKALGASDALLTRLFITEGAGLGLLGGACGYGVGAWLARSLELRLFGVALHLNLWILPVICVLTVALAVISAQAPVRLVRAIQPAVVLKGE